MKIVRKYGIPVLGLFGGFIVAVTALTGWSQTGPTLTITPLGTNQFSINITNNIGTNEYDLLWTPVLANPDFPWTWAAIGTSGQTNFIVNMGTYQSGFFMTFLDTNSIPLWEAANPTNQSDGILTVTINTPVNGSVVQ
jgi:hypothetical protein